ncbi:MAG: hypothetical protein QOI25_5474 [Mycobacterium sp.]|jgi:hypothetical protein|nr:hypothetical protein [Mycobacterium sp.]MDT5323587.1 hypothetical protein [Mycobacterium sp.]
MTLAADKDVAGDVFTIEDISTGMYASGFGCVGDGRTFSFRVERQLLAVEIYRPRLEVPVPHAEDVVAVASHSVANVDVNDERSLAAAVRDAVADAQPVPRTGR